MTNNSVNITVENQYGSEASISSEIIQLNGNIFTINQIVNVICNLPNAPVLTSSFDVGNLSIGEYQVVVNVENIGFPAASCSNSSQTQNSSFFVSGSNPTNVPIGGIYWGLLLIVLLVLLVPKSRFRKPA